MDTVTCLIIFGPLIVLAIGMAIAMAVLNCVENFNE
jgi:hypothetical protein